MSFRLKSLTGEGKPNCIDSTPSICGLIIPCTDQLYPIDQANTVLHTLGSRPFCPSDPEQNFESQVGLSNL